jgi:Predicted SAM-dependent methyltransferase
MKLSKRLLSVVKMIVNLKEVKIVADVGSDHGFLPTYLIKNGLCKKAYATEIAQGPLTACIQTIQQFDLEDIITPLLGNGLEPLLKINNHYDVITICGMGGNLIADILNKQIKELSFSYLILQPNTNEDYLRNYLFNNGFEIVDEIIVFDAKHRYEIIMAKFGEQIILDQEQDELFGPILRRDKNQIFLNKWQKELNICYKILDSLPENHPKSLEISKRITLIKGVLS